MKSRTYYSILLAVVSTLSGTAHAQSQRTASAAPATTVRYSDLDLTSAAGVSALDARIERAVSRVCANDGVRDISSMMDVRSCTITASAGARLAEQQAVQRRNEYAQGASVTRLARR